MAITKIFDDTSFDNSNINIMTAKHEAVTSHLSYMAQMKVSVFYTAVVDSFTQIIVCLVRQTSSNNASISQNRVNFWAYGSTSPEVDFKRICFCPFSQSKRNCFWIAGWCKSANANVHSVFDECSSCFSSSNFSHSCFAVHAGFNVNHVYLPP